MGFKYKNGKLTLKVRTCGLKDTLDKRIVKTLPKSKKTINEKITKELMKKPKIKRIC